MCQAGNAYSKLPGLCPQAQVQLRLEDQGVLFNIATVTLHIHQAERQGRFFDVAEHVAEEGFVIRFAHPQTRLSHVVAVRHGRRQGFTLAEQPGLHFMLHNVHRRVIQGHMMEQQHRGDSLIERVLGIDQTHQWRLSHIEAVVPRIEAAMQLRADLAVRRVKFKPFKVQLRLAPDHLHR